MSLFEIIGPVVLCMFITFYGLVRYQAPHGKGGDKQVGIFGYALVGAVFFPLAWLWVIGMRPTKRQLREEERTRLAAAAREYEREQARQADVYTRERARLDHEEEQKQLQLTQGEDETEEGMEVS